MNWLIEDYFASLRGNGTIKNQSENEFLHIWLEVSLRAAGPRWAETNRLCRADVNGEENKRLFLKSLFRHIKDFFVMLVVIRGSLNPLQRHCSCKWSHENRFVVLSVGGFISTMHYWFQGSSKCTRSTLSRSSVASIMRHEHEGKSQLFKKKWKSLKKKLNNMV